MKKTTTPKQPSHTQTHSWHCLHADTDPHAPKETHIYTVMSYLPLNLY